MTSTQTKTSEKIINSLNNNLTRVEKNCMHQSVGANSLWSLASGNYKEWLSQLLPTTRIIIEPKINGLPIALIYRDGILANAISSSGEDKKNELSLIQNVPKSIPIGKAIHIRGQLYGTSNTTIDTQRLTTGFNREAISQRAGLAFCSFQIINSNLNHFQSLQALKNLGFNIPQTEFTHYTSEVELYKKLWIESRLFKEYPTNGIVLKINSRKFQKQLGESKTCPRWSYAIKKY